MPEFPEYSEIISREASELAERTKIYAVFIYKNCFMSNILLLKKFRHKYRKNFIEFPLFF